MTNFLFMKYIVPGKLILPTTFTCRLYNLSYENGKQMGTFVCQTNKSRGKEAVLAALKEANNGKEIFDDGSFNHPVQVNAPENAPAWVSRIWNDVHTDVQS